jgi:formylglycine-generating enzyme required for sulfatase activity
MKKMIFTLLLLMSILSLNAQNYSPEMILLEGGTFNMGRIGSAYLDELPVHDVTLKSFYISKFETTVSEYKAFCVAVGFPPPTGNDELPAHNISWQEAVMYANWLSGVNGLKPCYEITREKKFFNVKFDVSANGFRLPTEAEWEYAARGGNKTKYTAYSGSDDAAEVSWNLMSGNKIHKVGQKKPNELGIFDMSGNCMEWCWDIYDAGYYKISPKDNPLGSESGTSRVCRGGNYMSTAETSRVTSRINYETHYKDDAMGLRLARNTE